MSDQRRVRVLCVDDNPLVVSSLVSRLRVEGWIDIAGTLSRADNLAASVEELNADVVLLDVDMPGHDPFAALEEVSARCPDVRTIILSGHVRADLIDRAVACGAWGYVSKTSAPAAIIGAIRSVCDGEFAFGADGPIRGVR